MTDDARCIRAVESVREAFGESWQLDRAALEVRVESGALPAAIAFLETRGELLPIAAGGRLVHFANLVETVRRALVRERESSVADLSARLDAPTALVCEALGWLEREGRVVARTATDGSIRFRSLDSKPS